jgi:hypothetical protein
MASHQLYERGPEAECDRQWCVGGGSWWCTLESQNGPVPIRGYWSEIYVREGEAWRIRVSTFVSKTPLPAPSAETK